MGSRNAIQTPNHGRRGMHARQGSPEALSRFFVGSSWEHLDLISPGGRFDSVAERFEAFKPFLNRPKPAVKPGA